MLKVGAGVVTADSTTRGKDGIHRRPELVFGEGQVVGLDHRRTLLVVERQGGNQRAVEGQGGGGVVGSS